jgi:ATP-dependent RNA helicase DDX10/DBP4
VSYTRSIYLQKDKEIFDISKVDLEGFAATMGLPGAPKIKFQKGDDAKRLKNAPRAALVDTDDDDSEGEGKHTEEKKKEVRTKYDRMFERRNQNVLSEHYSKLITEEGDEEKPDENADADEDDDFLSVKRVIEVDEELPEDMRDAAVVNAKVIEGLGEKPIVVDSKRREKLLKSKKKLLKLKGHGTKLVFDEEGNPHEIYELEDEEAFQARGTAEEQRQRFLEEEVKRVAAADVDDKQLAKEKKREKKEKRKAREMAEMDDDDDDAPQLVGDGEDPLALLRDLPLDDEFEEKEDRPAKRAKKWFEDKSDDEEESRKSKGRIIETDDVPDNLEDLEALAAGLLQ